MKIRGFTLTQSTLSQRLSFPLFHIKKLKRLSRLLPQNRDISIKQLQSFLGLENFDLIVDSVLKTWVSHFLQTVRWKRSLWDYTCLIKNQTFKEPCYEHKRLGQEILLKDSFLIPQPSVDLFIDANNAGWGYHTSEGYKAVELWSEKFLHLHINMKEMIVVYLDLKNISLPHLSCLKVYCENQTVVFTLKKRGLHQIKTSEQLYA